MKTNKYENKKKDNELTYQILLENVRIMFCHISEKNTIGEYASNKYDLKVVLPKEDEQTKSLMKVFADLSKASNGKEIKFNNKFYPLKENSLDDLAEKVKEATEENKKKMYENLLELSKTNYFMNLSSDFEIKVVDKAGKDVEDLATVIFNNEIVNLQFKVIQPKGKQYFSRFPQGIQLLEVKRKNTSGLMFDLDSDANEDSEELPF